MLKHVRNAAFAIVGEVHRIDDAPSGGAVWPTLLVLSVAASFWFPGGAPVGASQIMWCILIPLFARLAASASERRELNLRRFCIVAVSTGLLGYCLAAAGGPPLLVWGYMLLAGVFVFRAALIPGVPQPTVPAGFPERIDPLDARSLRAMRARSDVTFRETGPAIATFMGADVPEWFVDANGRRHVFVCTCADPERRPLREGESLVLPGLIYELDGPEKITTIH